MRRPNSYKGRAAPIGKPTVPTAKSASPALPPVNAKCRFAGCDETALRIVESKVSNRSFAVCVKHVKPLVDTAMFIQVMQGYPHLLSNGVIDLNTTDVAPVRSSAQSVHRREQAADVKPGASVSRDERGRSVSADTTEGKTPGGSSAAARNSHTADQILDIESAPQDEDKLTKISRLATRQLEIEADIERLTKELAEKNNELKINQEVDLPEVMSSANTTGLTIEGGHEIVIENVVAAGITEANAPTAFSFLEKIGRENYISRVITIKFNKDEEKWAAKFMRDMEQRKKKLKAVIKLSVHKSTLGAFVRANDALDADDDDKIDLNQVIDKKNGLTAEKVLGVFRLRKAVVKRNPDAKRGDASVL